ncbi:MAG: DUF3226 domain-containing protein [Cetobacterium sp.]|uniref:DUF3226 domain-containing protein n=1 Tax=Cetobacterium sp. TaxID=2071632 RepID=UPI003F31CA42
MKLNLIYVEGMHDLGVISDILKESIGERIKHIDDLPEEGKVFIPTNYPLEDGKLDRILPIPDFFKKDDSLVALIKANGENNILNTIDSHLFKIKALSLKELKKINKVVIFIDGDDKNRVDKIKTFIADYSRGEDGIIVEVKESYLGIEKGGNISLDIYTFPNNKDEGVLEDILLECIEDMYTDEAESFVSKVEISCDRTKKLLSKGNSNRKKAIVSCVGNVVVEPSSSGSVYIGKSKWIKNNLKTNERLQKIKLFLDEVLELSK